ncbi:MAG: hypothetical protein U0802_09045 [Candidatus Binatia bacterium]
MSASGGRDRNRGSLRRRRLRPARHPGPHRPHRAPTPRRSERRTDRHLIARYGARSLHKLTAAYASDASSTDIFRAALPIELTSFEDDLRCEQGGSRGFGTRGALA